MRRIRSTRRPVPPAPPSAGHRPSRPRRLAVATLLAAAAIAAAGCSGDEAGGTTVADRDAAQAPAAPAVIRPSPAPYRLATSGAMGTIAGNVRLAGDPPADSTIRPTMDVRVCGASFVDRTIVRRGEGLGDVVVWLVDVGAGKPLPARRRFTLDNVRCRLEPRVQAVIAGGTLNVRSSDAVLHRTRALRHGTEQVLARWEHNDFGQVVPDDRVLREPGLIELRSEVHPWTRGWVAVFDHPYFVVTPPSGVFTLDGVPPGSYTLAAWHERFGRLEQPVTVAAGQATPVTITFGAGAENGGGP